MQLKDILKKSESKLLKKDYSLRKINISKEDRPYREKKFSKNGRQIDDNSETKGRQDLSSSDHEYNLNTNINGRQIDDNSETKGRQDLSYSDQEYDLNTNINGRQIDDNSETKGRQDLSYSDQEYNLNTNVNGRQIDDNSETKGRQDLSYSDQEYNLNTNVNGRQIDDNSETKGRQDLSYSDQEYNLNTNVNGRQIDDNSETKGRRVEKNLYINRKHLSINGNEKLLYIWIKNKCSEKNITKPITKSEILEDLQIRESCLKKTIDRLIIKKIIKIKNSQNGRFGWRIFEVNNPNNLYIN